MKNNIFVFCCIALIIGLRTVASAQTGSPSANSSIDSAPQPIPILDGAAGPCSVEFAVTTPGGKAADGAKVSVHIAYRFGGFHKLDLEAGTNSEGKVKFTGLPARVRRSQLEFEAVKDSWTGTTTVDPAKECSARREIKLGAKAAPAAER